MCAKALLTRGRKGLPADGERGFYYPTATPRSTGRPNSFYNRTQTSDQGSPAMCERSCRDEDI